MVANAVINAENASLKTMNTDQLLDLFATTETKKVWFTIMRLGSVVNVIGNISDLFLIIRSDLFFGKIVSNDQLKLFSEPCWSAV